MSDSSSDDDAPIKSNLSTKMDEDDSSSEESSSDDDIPINQSLRNNNANKSKLKSTTTNSNDTHSSTDDDAPLISSKKKPKSLPTSSSSSSSTSPLISKRKRKRSNRFNDSDESDDDQDDPSSSSDDNQPIVATTIIKRPPKKKPRTMSNSPRRRNNDYYSSSNNNNNSTPRKRKKGNSSAPGYIGRECNDASLYKMKANISELAPKKGALKWWEHENDNIVSYSAKDDSKSKIKWHTLDHNGVVFAPPYEPHNIAIKYNGKSIKLTPQQEEIATMFGVMIETDWAQKDKFRKNFMKEFTKILRDKNQSSTHPEIKDLDKCDFRDIYDWYQNKKAAEKEKKKDKTYKEKIKEEKAKYDALYGYALVDGIREKVGNYKVEPPGLFRGRGEHPKMGMLKRRILPRHIILNIGEQTPIPPCPISGEQWGGVIHDKTVTYIAKWVENINGQHKFVYLGASSRFKGQNDRNKYEKARVLKTKIDSIRQDYESKLISKNLMCKQLATAVWMIDRLSIRVGNEKDTDEEADTVGVCSLRKEHITLLDVEIENNNNHDDESSSDDDIPINNSRNKNNNNNTKYIYKITLDFLGKDSMRYHQTVKVTHQIYKNLRNFLKGKNDDMDIFEKIDPNKVNDYLRNQMEGLTAKVFRTHNASTTLQIELSKSYHPSIGKLTSLSSLDEKIFFYNQCNMQVAILCNHQRSVSKTHAEQLQKIDQQINDFKETIAELQEEYDIKTGKIKRRKKKKKKKKDDDKDNNTPKKKKKKEQKNNY